MSEDADDTTVKDQNPGGKVGSNVTENWILSGRQIVRERGSNTNGTESEEGSKLRRRRRKKKERKGKLEQTRKAYNESAQREEWEDYIFKR